jgi:hypothetical protein
LVHEQLRSGRFDDLNIGMGTSKDAKTRLARSAAAFVTHKGCAKGQSSICGKTAGNPAEHVRVRDTAAGHVALKETDRAIIDGYRRPNAHRLADSESMRPR